MVVTSRNDDFPTPGFEIGIEEFQKRKMWFGCSVVTSWINLTTWNFLQQEINQGYVEVYSHSRTHPPAGFDYIYNRFVTYPSIDSEVNGSKEDILGNLTLPFGGYLLTYVAPYDYYDVDIREMCRQCHYLIETDDSELGLVNSSQYAELNSQELFNHVSTVQMDSNSDMIVLNKTFDKVYSEGGIYQLLTHPIRVSWTLSEVHLDYISGRKDVWYAPLTGIYLYRYVELFVSVS
jgi:hypothetical protein